jgi:ribosomal protein S18 acetylase RimI-like enzyme
MRAMAQPRPKVRPYDACDQQATAALLYESAGGMYDRYAGTRRLAERTLARALACEGTTASAHVVRVAELDGRVAGAMAAMPFDEWAPRAHAFLRTTLRSIPPWRWPAALWLYRASGRTAPTPPALSFYVDSLATAEQFRRRGVGRALLDDAEGQAREHGSSTLALDTWVDNRPARALYMKAGFVETGRTPAASGLPGGVSLLKQLS